jgi:hypothetical protein
MLSDEEIEDEWIDDHPSITTKCDVLHRCWRPGVSLHQAVPPPVSLLWGVDNLPLLIL